MFPRVLLMGIAVLVALPLHADDDSKPDDTLSVVQGEWRGTLTYRDYGKPDKLVKLPTKLYAALSSPNELVLHYVYDDGPGKTVYSYERMKFDFAKGELTWISGLSKKSESVSRIIANVQVGDLRRLVFERDSEKGKDQFTTELGGKDFSLKKEEIDAKGSVLFRNKYEFRRPGA